MMKFLTIVILLICFVNTAYAGEEVSKSQSARKVLDATEEIYRLATSNPNTAQPVIRQLVTEVVAKLYNMDQLASLAVIAYNIAWPQDACDVSFDLWFDEAFWISLGLVGENKTEEGRRALQQIKWRVLVDGALSLEFKILEEKQKEGGE